MGEVVRAMDKKKVLVKVKAAGPGTSHLPLLSRTVVRREDTVLTLV